MGRGTLGNAWNGMSKDNDDILRYRNNQMSEAERNAFERRALLDPFLSDALEGAEKIEPALYAKDIDQIKKKLRNSAPSRWQIPLRIAAGIFLVVTLGWLMFRDTNLVPEPLALQKKDSISTPARDSTSQLLTLAKPTEKTPVTTDSKSTDAREKELTKAIDVAGPTADDSPATGIETSTQAEGTQPAQPPIQNPAEVTIAATELSSADDTKKAEAEEPARRMKQVPAPSGQGRSQSSQSKDDIETRSEVIILPPKVQPDSSTSLAEPTGGMDAYRRYLIDNQRMPREAQSASIQGKVTISFTVQPDGTLTSFTTQKSLGYGCDEEVVRLIAAGPSWTPTIHQGKSLATTVSVTLAFNATR